MTNKTSKDDANLDEMISMTADAYKLLAKQTKFTKNNSQVMKNTLYTFTCLHSLYYNKSIQGCGLLSTVFLPVVTGPCVITTHIRHKGWVTPG